MVSSRVRRVHQEGEAYKPLTYRLRRRVHFQSEGEKPCLVLDFPLKAVLLHSSWMPVLALLSKGDDVVFEKICSLMSPSPAEKVETFLNELVRKGFLDRIGLSPLARYPSVSVIIPVRNRPQDIKSCLDSLIRLEYPKDNLEIIVVDDASSDNTPGEVANFPVSLISLKGHKQASFCRNQGALRAKGDILAFIDSDCIADPLWLRELIPAFNDPSVGAVGGFVDSASRESSLDRYEEVRSSLNVGPWFRRSMEKDKFFYVPSCNLLVRRDLFLRLNGFREELHVGEDVDFCWRVQDIGYHVDYMPTGKVSHRHRNRWVPFCSRRFDYGTSEPLLQHLHGKRVKQLTLPIGESIFWVLIILSLWSANLIPFGLSWTAGLADSLILRRRIALSGIAVPYHRILAARFRSYFAFFYHLSSFVSRYYLVWAMILWPAAPTVGTVIVGMHLLSGLGEFLIKKPFLNLFFFLFYFSMEQFSYQLGVWWGCLKNLYFGPVNPRLLLGRGI